MMILSLILGILLVIGGFWCVASPLTLYSLLPTLLAIAILAEGIGSFMIWLSLRKIGQPGSSLLLVTAILSVFVGASLLLDEQLQLTMVLMIPFIVGGWLVVTGIFRVINAFQIRKLGREAESVPAADGDARRVKAVLNEIGRTWWLHLAVGILMVIAGGVSCSSPLVLIGMIGTFMGIDVVFSGLNLIFAAFEA